VTAADAEGLVGRLDAELVAATRVALLVVVQTVEAVDEVGFDLLRWAFATVTP